MPDNRDVVDQPGYVQLLDRAASCAAELCHSHFDVEGGSARFIAREAARLATAWSGRVKLEASHAPADTMLALLAANWPDLAAARITGEELMRGRAQLWESFMTEWPLGSYAQLAAEHLRAAGLLHGRVLELGAGVGNTSRLVAHEVDGEYVRTDLIPELLAAQKLPGRAERYDFNRPSHWRDLDTVFAVNALHCARDRPAALRNVREMLREGGTLVLGEGSPETRPGLPWALSFLCGLFAGWWDQGGFVPHATWEQELLSAGFSEVKARRLVSEGHDLGGLLIAVR